MLYNRKSWKKNSFNSLGIYNTIDQKSVVSDGITNITSCVFSTSSVNKSMSSWNDISIRKLLGNLNSSWDWRINLSVTSNKSTRSHWWCLIANWSWFWTDIMVWKRSLSQRNCCGSVSSLFSCLGHVKLVQGNFIVPLGLTEFSLSIDVQSSNGSQLF